MFRLPEQELLPEARQLHVLVVDDEPTLRLGFTYALANRGILVDCAATGQEALDQVKIHSFDIMILDLRMPDLDGMGVIEALRNSGHTIPIVLCSAALTPNAALCAIRHGVVDFLLKPVRPVDLRQVVEFVIQPESRSFPQAMKAARQGRPDEAIRILETEPTPSRQAVHWLVLLKTLRDAEGEHTNLALETKIRASLAILAFNAPANA